MLLSAVKVHRQHYRGLRWYILQDPASNQYSRLNDAAYHFVARLDGRRTVSQVWRICMEQFGDAAPTQGEVIQLLGRLHAANLLYGDIAPDAEALFKRHRKRRWREVQGLLTNIFFIRIPLWDPDRFLGRWVRVFGRLFTWYGFLIWLALIAAGLFSAGSHANDLTEQARGLLNPKNLPLLYLALVIAKLFHEMGHAFSCKTFGQKAGSGGEVHQMGVTFLIMTPLPYVDASSAWALRGKWQRIVVGASGMLVELAIAAIAAIIWSRTAEGTTLHAICYNIMFIASVSSLIFNGNPLLRYDAYYILSDLLEIPNLESRSKQYFGYLVKRYLWGIDKAYDPSHTADERGWLVFYAVASTLCRVIVFSAIILFLGQQHLAIGFLFAAIVITGWVLIPFGKLIRYLATDRELHRLRTRAVFSSSIAIFLLLITTAFVNMPDRCRIEGIVEPARFAVIHMKTAGYIHGFLDSGSRTGPGGRPIIKASNPDLETERDQLEAEFRRLQISRQFAQTRETAKTQIMDQKLAALQEKMERIRMDLQSLELKAPIPGTWVAPDIDRMTGRYITRGQRLGVVADLEDLRIRAVAGQTVAARLIKEKNPAVAIRIKGKPELTLSGRIEKIIPAGQEKLPSAALGYSAGGSTRIDLEDPSGRLAAEPFFEIIVVPLLPESSRVRPGQTMNLMFETSPKPLLVQGWRSLLQVFQRRFQV